MARLTPVRPEAMTDDQRTLYDAILGGKRGPGMRREDGALIGPFNAMLLNPHVGDRVQRLGEALRFDISLPRNVIEVATLVVGSHWRAQFEWWAHERLAKQAGVSEAVITAIKHGERPDFSNDDEAGAYDVVMPDMKYIGGIHEMQRTAVECEALGVEVSPHNPSGPICHAASLQVSASLGAFDMLELQFDESPLFDSLVGAPFARVSHGHAELPPGPGLGVRLADAILTRHSDRPSRKWRR